MDEQQGGTGHMYISLDALEKALAPIEAVGQGEITFDVGNTPITLRIITPEQEVEVQRYANQALNGENSQGDAADYLERFKLAVLSHAIVGVGENDFRNVDFVETPEKLQNGQSVKLPKHQAIRQVLTRWTGPIRVSIFRKYTDLIGDVEIKAEKAIHFEPSDIDAEIDRLERRLEQLREEKERQQKTAADRVSSVSKMAKAIREDEEKARETRQDNQTDIAVSSARRIDATEVDPVAAPPTRQPISPTMAAPPATPPQPAAVATAQATHQPPSAEEPPQAPIPEVPRDPTFDEMYDSVVDASDQDAMQAAVEAENQRLLRSRQAAGRARVVPPMGMRRPPHMDAVDAQAEAAPFVGMSPEGQETYRMPPEALIDRRARVEGETVDLNREVDSRSANPRFRPPPR